MTQAQRWGVIPPQNHHDLLVLKPKLFHISTKVWVERIKEPLSRGEIFKMEMELTGNIVLPSGVPHNVTSLANTDHRTERNIFFPL